MTLHQREAQRFIEDHWRESVVVLTIIILYLLGRVYIGGPFFG